MTCPLPPIPEPGYGHLPQMTVGDIRGGGRVYSGSQRVSAGRKVMEANYKAANGLAKDAKLPDGWDLHHRHTDGNLRGTDLGRAYLLHGGDPDAGFNLSLMPNRTALNWPTGKLGHPSAGKPDAHPEWDFRTLGRLRSREAALARRGITPDQYLDPNHAGTIRSALERDMRQLGGMIDKGHPGVPKEATTWQGQARDVLYSVVPPLAAGLAGTHHDEDQDEKN